VPVCDYVRCVHTLPSGGVHTICPMLFLFNTEKYAALLSVWGGICGCGTRGVVDSLGYVLANLSIIYSAVNLNSDPLSGEHGGNFIQGPFLVLKSPNFWCRS